MMKAGAARPGRDYARLLLWLAAAAAALIAVGSLPTRELGGEEAWIAMLAGCAVSFVGSAIGALPVLVSGLGGGAAAPASLLASLGLRFLIVLGGALLLSLSGAVADTPFLIWVGISYLAFLVFDVLYALRQQRTS